MRIVRLTPPRRGALFLALPALVLIGGAFVAPTTATANIEDAKSYFAAAQKELHGGNLRAAEIELRNAVEADPNNTAIRIELADVYLKLRNFPAAEIEARVALQKGGNRNQAEPILAESLFRQRRFNQLFKEVKPAHLNPAAESHVRMDLGLAHLNLGEMAEAEPLLREAEKLDPTGAGPKIAIAQLLLAKKDLKGAQSEADAAVGIAPNNPDVLRLDGEILRREGNEAGALSLFNQILAKNPNHIPTLVSRADLYIAKKNLAAAKGDVDRVLKIAPKNRFAIYLSALIEAKTGKFQAADQTLQQDAAEMEENPGYLYLSGAVKYALHQYVLADTDLTKFVAREPRNGAGWRLLGLTALAEHDFGKVIRVLKSYTDATPSDRVAVSALGRAYMASGASDKAIELFQRVANAEPSDPGAQMQLAFTRLQSGETDRAVGELENIVRTSAGAKMAGPLLAMIDLRKGDVAAAAATAEKLVSLNGKAPVALTTLALVRFAQGNYAEAAKILTGVIQKAPKFLTARFDLARLYETEGRPADAERELKALLLVQPNDERTLMMLGTLAAAAKKDGEVESYLRQAQQAHPKSAAPGVQLVRFYAAGKNWSRATALGRELAVQFPNDLAVLDLLVEVRAASGDIAGATADVQHLMERFPKSPQLLIQLAGFEMKRNDLTDARQSLLRAIALAPNNDSYMEALVDLDFKTKGADAALATARSFAPKHAELSGLSVARVLANAKRPADALAALEALQRQHPSTAIAIRIAEFTYATGKHDQAVAFLLAWLKEHQDATVARFMIATFYLQDRESHKAQAEYERVLAETPANALAANNLANIYEDESDPRALALAERAYRELPSAQIGDTLGWILLRAGDRPRAMFYLRNAGAAVPANLTIQYHLAVGLDQTGDKKNAIALLERVVSSSRPFADKSDAEKLLAKLQHG